MRHLSTGGSQRWVFDPLLGYLEQFSAAHAQEIGAQNESTRAEIWQTIHSGAREAKSRSAQFRLLRDGVGRATQLFRDIAQAVSKETLMSIARRAPAAAMQGADLTLATLLVKYGASNPGMSYEAGTRGKHDLGVMFTEDEVFASFRLMAIARIIVELEGKARCVGKGASLRVTDAGQAELHMPDDVSAAITAYEHRRPRGALFDSGGFFVRQQDPANWSDFRVPNLIELPPGSYFEAPLGSRRHLLFERWPTMLDAGGLARLLRGYDHAIREDWGAGADAILHFMTALATLIHHTSPNLARGGTQAAFDPGDSLEHFEHSIGFLFALAHKGFLRFPRDDLLYHLGRVRTVLAPDEAAGTRLGSEFIDAFLFRPDQRDSFECTPFLHASTGGYLYIDLLLQWDFLAGVLEGAKNWYSSQHGDWFMLDLKQWLDTELPGFVLGAKLPVRLEGGGTSDIDLLTKGPDGLLLVECKAYGKSEEFMVGAPDAVTARRGMIRDAVRQADRAAQAFSAAIAAGNTGYARDTQVTAIVCTPSVEFLKPLNEFGMVAERFPRVMTPEEVVELGATHVGR